MFIISTKLYQLEHIFLLQKLYQHLPEIKCTTTSPTPCFAGVHICSTPSVSNYKTSQRFEHRLHTDVHRHILECGFTPFLHMQSLLESLKRILFRHGGSRLKVSRKKGYMTCRVQHIADSAGNQDDAIQTLHFVRFRLTRDYLGLYITTRLIMTFTSLTLLHCLHCLHSDFAPHLNVLLSAKGIGQNFSKLVVCVHVLDLNHPFVNALMDVVELGIYVLALLVMNQIFEQ